MPCVLAHVPAPGKSSPTADETIRTRHDKAACHDRQDALATKYQEAARQAQTKIAHSWRTRAHLGGAKLEVYVATTRIMPLTCCSWVELRGFEPLTPSMRTRSCLSGSVGHSSWMPGKCRLSE